MAVSPSSQAEDRISRITCEFASEELESRFRLSTQKRSDFALRFGGGLFLFFYLLGSTSDVLRFGFSLELLALFPARAAFIAVSIAIIISASKANSPRTNDLLVLLAGLTMAVAQNYIVVIKDLGTIYHGMTAQLVILAFYFFLPTRLIYKVLIGIVQAVTYITVANIFFDPSVLENYSLIVLLVFACNAIGITMNYRSHLIERIEFSDSQRLKKEIEDRAEIEAALKESEERYALAMRASSDHIYTWDAVNDKLMVSLFKTEAFGIKDEPVTSHEWLGRIHPEDRGHFRNKMVAHLRGETESFNAEYRLRDDKDTYHFVRQHAIGKRDDNGRVSWMAGAAIDITKQKIAEQKVMKSEELYRAIFNNAGAGIVISGADGQISQCNDVWADMMEMRGSDSCKSGTCPSFMEVTYKDDRKSLKKCLKDLGDGKISSSRLELRFIRPEGTEWWGGLSLSAIHEADGTVQTVVGVVNDISERKEREDELRRRASTDPLTGVANRRSFTERSEKELHRAQRYKRPMSLLLIDLDHFKQVNDTYGHAAGDDALKQTTTHCLHILREQDILGRIGGEEFAVTLPEIDQTHALEAAERLRDGIANLTIKSGDLTFSLTTSIGVTTVRNGENDLKAALDRADKALYAAKDGGRNRVESA